MELTYGSPAPNGGTFEVRVGTHAVLNAETQDTRSFKTYKPHVIGKVRIAADSRHLAIRPTHLNEGGLMNLASVRLIPIAGVKDR